MSWSPQPAPMSPSTKATTVIDVMVKVLGKTFSRPSALGLGRGAGGRRSAHVRVHEGGHSRCADVGCDASAMAVGGMDPDLSRSAVPAAEAPAWNFEPMLRPGSRRQASATRSTAPPEEIVTWFTSRATLVPNCASPRPASLAAMYTSQLDT